MNEREKILLKEGHAKNIRKQFDKFMDPRVYAPVFGQELDAEQLETIVNLTKPYMQLTEQYNMCITWAFARAVLDDDMGALAARTKELTEGLNKCLTYLTDLIE